MPTARYNAASHELIIKLDGVSQEKAREQFLALAECLKNRSDHALSCMSKAIFAGLGMESTCIHCEIQQKKRSKTA